MASMLMQIYIQFYQMNLKIIKYYFTFSFFLALIESFFSIKLNNLLKKLLAISFGIHISSEKFCIISSSYTIFIFSISKYFSSILFLFFLISNSALIFTNKNPLKK